MNAMAAPARPQAGVLLVPGLLHAAQAARLFPDSKELV